ncbi:prolyl oligopeptidase family serine peptidase [Stieleria sp. JC731]|uniref:S9 family peptidase n=1 Tax=Pirellulaceae TaxID=2691357 RepID=UPI001E3DB973|nr:prolyl oligopeptidase family serine peptidase [Stieleria sp. JC731]MCC9600297.1 prolyl oligopeptidase family serine peptidase [Stieleria sp. JC731]
MMNRLLCTASLSLLVGCLFIPQVFAADSKEEVKQDELQLEDLYPEKGLFGPSASSTEFSHDGRYAAYLYRPYVERRHGNDLWIYDFKKSEARRITSIDMLSKFQRSARIVIDDRLEKHRKESKKEEEKEDDADKEEDEDGAEKSDQPEEDDKKKTELSEKEREEQRQIYTTVGEDDADAEYSPVYSGIASFRWHPKENKLLLISEGDIYLLENLSKPKLTRLTKTDQRESQVEFLPDGSGYTVRRDDTVIQTKFGEHLVHQLTPSLPSGENLNRYALSHDGKRIALISRTNSRGESRKVDIIRYRDRFAESDSISRTVSDDKVEPETVRVYLYEFEDLDTEDAPLLKVFEEKIDEPRDIISEPRWSLDNQKVTFCFFDQKNSDVQIRLATWPTEEELEEGLKEATKKREKEFQKDMREAKEKDEEDATPGRRGPRGGRTKAPELVEHLAKTAFQFKHYGGPNTPSMVSPDFAQDSRHIVFVSELSGFRHIHVLDPLYESVRQLTEGRFEVYPIRFSEDRKRLFVTATKDSPARQMVYVLDMDSGELTRLNKQEGTFSDLAVSNNGKRMIGNFVRYGSLTELIAQNEKKQVKQITDSHPEQASQLTKIEPEFFEYENRHGHTISGMMFKPEKWKKSKKHPLLIYVYGGPLGSRHFVNDGGYSADAYFFQMYMAQKHGYITIVVDPRGQSGYGGLFEKSNYEQVGKPQVEDLVDGVKYMADNFNIDEERVAISGWSFGGFQTQMCLYTEPEVFQVGIAGAGPTQWENYNSWYSTGTVGPSRTGEPDQEKYSLIPLAKKLKGQLLLVHGIEDTNVLFQDTVAVYRALLKAGKETQVELFLDPTGGHGLGGDVKRLGRMRKYEQFLLRTIGEGP